MNLLLLVLVPACFALNPVIARAVIDQFGPATLSVIRWLLSALLIALGALWLGQQSGWRAPARSLLGISFLGVLGMGFCAYAAYEAARTTQAANIGLIYGCTTAFVAAWEVAAGRQSAKGLLLAGIAACLLGVLLTLTKGHPEALRDLSFAAGDLWAAAGMLVFAFYTIALRRMPPSLSPLAQFTAMSAAAALAFLPLAGIEVAQIGWPVLGPRTLAWLLALVLLAGIGAYLGYNISVRRNGPVLTAASICLTPIYAALQAMVLLGEALAWYHGAALVLVVTGLLAINRA
ncbi:MAG: DMT family transporter [Hyphomicrobiaceae bacterium]|nr:DMT family transporter [Hyphomicrobiaceae bacterium]